MTASRSTRLLICGACLSLCNLVVGQQPFDLDPSFRTEIDTWYVSSILPLDDGDLLVSGQIKFPGDLSFRTGGRVNADGTRDPGYPDAAFMGGKLIRWNDKVYARSGQGMYRTFLSGGLDSDFNLNTAPHFSPLQGGDYHVFPDGRVLYSGLHQLNDAAHGYVGSYCLCWFSNEGYLDTTRIHRTCSGALLRFRELPDGKFIGSGTTASYDGQAASNIFRFNADGSLDPSFQASVSSGRAFGFLPLQDGRVYAGGSFKVTGITDTLRLVRFMSDGTLDPSFNNFNSFANTDLSGTILVSAIHQLDASRLIIMGGFETVNGEPRQSICLVDTTGALIDDYFWGPGCGDYDYQGFTYGSLEGIVPAPDGSYYIWGAYHGYDDGTTNDTTQRMVSRLYGLDVGIEERQVELHASLKLHPNPASTWVAFDYDLRGLADEAKLIVIDATGREVWRASLVVSKTQVLWDVRGVQPGTYAAILENGGARLTTERLVLQQ